MQEKKFIEKWLDCGVLFGMGDGRLLIGWGKRKWMAAHDDAYPSFYFPDYFLKHPVPWFIHEHYRETTVQQLMSELDKTDTSNCLEKYEWTNSYKKLFENEFKKLKSLIASGKLKKGVPFVMETSDKTMGKQQIAKSLKSMLAYSLKHPVYLYGFWADKEGILGATPEVLFCKSASGLLETMACAGTKNIHEASSTFLADPKELYEHELVIKGISESLSPYGKVTLGNLQLLKLSHLMHLVTPLSVKLFRSTSFEAIVKALHPTPAVGVFPKNEGAVWLESYQQKIERFRFGAPLGYLLQGNQSCNCYVAIRNIQWNQQKMYIAAGCGVVAESHLDKEWDEINLKLKAIKEILAL
jgi:menaquinone-specific isochorismate synthase